MSGVSGQLGSCERSKNLPAPIAFWANIADEWLLLCMGSNVSYHVLSFLEGLITLRTLPLSALSTP